MKAKIEKDKTHIMHEIADVRAATDEVVRSKASGEKSHKNLLDSLNAIGKKVEEANLTLGDYDAAKRKLTAENADVLRQLQELENSANVLVKVKNFILLFLVTLSNQHQLQFVGELKLGFYSPRLIKRLQV